MSPQTPTPRTPVLGLCLILALSPLAVTAAPQTFVIDAVHSTVLFKIKHMQVSYAFGRFTDLSGEIRLDPASPAAGSLDLAIKTASVDTGNERRDQHLRGPDFFDAKQFPVMRFRSTGVASQGEDRYRLHGEMTIKGVKKTLAIPVQHTGTAQDRRGKTLVGALAVFTIQRSDFGIDYMVGPLADTVEITVSLEAKQK